MDLLAGVEDRGGAGGEFAVDDDEVTEVVGVWRGLIGLVDGESEALGAEDGVEADQAFVCGGERGGECEVAAEDGNEGGERDEGVEVPVEEAAVCRRIVDAGRGALCAGE